MALIDESSTDSTSTTISNLSEPSVLGPMTPPMTEDNSIDCIFCLESLPYDCIPTVGQYMPVARLLPCTHQVHDECLKPWTERASSCPICRTNFNKVEILPFVTGSVFTTYNVESKTQKVENDEGSYAIPPDAWEQPEIAVAEEPPQGTRRRGATSARREQAQWEWAWSQLEADFNQDGSDVEPDQYFGNEDMIAEQRRRIAHFSQMRSRRARVAAAQVADNDNANRTTLRIWDIPFSRPRLVFPHLQREMTQEESDSWKMMEMAEKLETAQKKRSRSKSRSRSHSPSERDVLYRMGTAESSQSGAERRKFKRPRTKRDSQLTSLNALVKPEPSSTVSVNEAPPHAEHADAASPPASSPPASGGLFSSLLEGIGRSRDISVFQAADVHGRDLGKMRPMSPDRCSVSSGMSRSVSPPLTCSPHSPPSSRPTSPNGVRGRPKLSTSPTGMRTPAQSPERSTRTKAWENLARPSSGSESESSEKQHKNKQPAVSYNDGEPSRRNCATNNIPSGYSTRIPQQKKREVMEMVKAALKPHYPSEISKENYVIINKKICRAMYKHIFETERDDQKELQAAILTQVVREIQNL